MSEEAGGVSNGVNDGLSVSLKRREISDMKQSVTYTKSSYLMRFGEKEKDAVNSRWAHLLSLKD